MMLPTVQFLFFKTLLLAFVLLLGACASHDEKDMRPAEEIKYDRSKKMKNQAI